MVEVEWIEVMNGTFSLIRTFTHAQSQFPKPAVRKKELSRYRSTDDVSRFPRAHYDFNYGFFFGSRSTVCAAGAPLIGIQGGRCWFCDFFNSSRRHSRRPSFHFVCFPVRRGSERSDGFKFIFVICGVRLPMEEEMRNRRGNIFRVGYNYGISFSRRQTRTGRIKASQNGSQPISA